MSGGEIFLIMLVVLIFFGAEKIPEVARGLGKGLREFKRATDEIKSEITNSTEGIRNEMQDIRTDISNSASIARQELNEIRTEIRQTSDEPKAEPKTETHDPSYSIYNELKNEGNPETGESGKSDSTNATSGSKEDFYKGANI